MLLSYIFDLQRLLGAVRTYCTRLRAAVTIRVSVHVCRASNQPAWATSTSFIDRFVRLHLPSIRASRSDEDLSSLWRELDPNGDGAVTIREMTTALHASAARATEQDSRCGRPQWTASKLKAVAAFSSRSGWA